MNIEELAMRAKALLLSTPYAYFYQDNREVEPGWFVVRNDATGQSKRVLYHPESGYVFKDEWEGDVTPQRASKRYIGEFTIDGVTYPVRLPEFHLFPADDDGFVMVQEYITGEPCKCLMSWCDHAKELASVTNCSDTHRGNWKIMGDEIVLFDFEGIKL